ncbi:MAG TPA: CHASE2 and HATPase_c domain-containing protein [Methylotenera sp.]|nr:CHASE2 and HATPase_c domain-containing protein [Methylotenera sp.]HPH04852.1 CHASE2 and HATPase_c domain-containing protein [Methylotenera sp.]HPN01416.1 CHASE2 and HATPase_c domain-containing protein [Methylotenera sp.]
MPIAKIKFNLFHALGDRLFTAIILAIIAVSITYTGLFSRLDYLHYDLSHYFNFKPAPKDVVIIAIDESSLTKLGRWPWSRSVHAELVNRLSAENAKVIGLDLILDEPDLNDSDADKALALAIEKAGNVVLPELLGHVYADYSDNSILKNAAALGRVRVPLDIDGIARSFYIWEGFSGGGLPEKHFQHFSQAVLVVAKQLPASFQMNAPKSKTTNTQVDLIPQLFVAQEIRKVKFLGPPKHFQRIAYADVLAGQYSNQFFKNKIVLVGATAAGLGDVLPTPVSALVEPMPGIEFHANAITSMREDALIKNAPLWLSSMLCVMFAIVPLFFLPKLSPLKSLILIGVYYIFVVYLAIVLPSAMNLWVPPAGAIVAILSAYPIWSWRKLESAQVYLDKAFLNLRTELAQMGLEKAYLGNDVTQDEMQSRIAKVELASQYLRESQQKRLDILSFISHDIRTPLAAAMMQLDEDVLLSTQHAERIKQMLGRALNMADEFLQSSRAEMVDAAKFSDVNMQGLIQQSVDDIYSTATAKGIQVKTTLPEKDIWVRGDFGLLQRVFTNLILNAVKYSQDHTIVQVNFSHRLDKAVFNIIDTGPGIPTEKLQKLFKRFGRVEGEYQLPVGTGLGLYFVHICIQKHGGSISVESRAGIGTQFTVELPITHVESQ